uniref:cGMP-dependent protein kinase n=1 Tax=Hippocampus comes TaxID=109280 RepID=A0A3Q3D1R2_HIPCM
MIQLGQICVSFLQDYFEKGEYIIREGEDGNTFFIIAKGEVIVTKTTEGFAEPQQIKTLGIGDYFGEKALIRFVSTFSTCLRPSFFCMPSTGNVSSIHPCSDLLILTWVEERAGAYRSCLGAFSLTLITVSQVKLKGEDTTFALKCIKKMHVVDTRQQEHVYSEKNILQQTNSAFIIRLFRTFRDNKHIYMLLEVCLGGELWTVLRDMNYFDDPTARFCIGCVLEAFDYLHTMGIIYRDLKPENLLLDAKGYVKMADFGFAKKIGLGKKTWTFCGTPEYVAPEVIMNKGHDFGADCWSLGILIYELLTGNPPFAGSDPIKIYTMVLHGIEKVDFPKRIGKRPEDLIRRLCKYGPDRLNGPMDHSHFDIFPPDAEMTPDETSGWDKDF